MFFLSLLPVQERGVLFRGQTVGRFLRQLPERVARVSTSCLFPPVFLHEGAVLQPFVVVHLSQMMLGGCRMWSFGFVSVVFLDECLERRTRERVKT